MLKLRVYWLPGLDGGPAYYGFYIGTNGRSIDFAINRDGIAITRYNGNFRFWLFDFETGKVIKS